MWSRRRFLGACAASSAGLAWPGIAPADDKPEVKKPDPLLPPAAAAAIAAGLKYLAAQQQKDGSFGTRAYRGNVGVTSLCGLALLSGGHRPGKGPFGTTLDRALDFVATQEDPGQRGFLHNPKASPHGPMYNHGFAVSFLAAAWDKVADRPRAGRVGEVLRRAVALTLKSPQNAEKAWRYHPRSKDSDLTVTAVQVAALRAARDAGVGVPRAALAGTADYLKRCQDRKGGGFRYMARGGGPNWSRTAAALLGLYCAGVTRGPEVERGLAYLLANRPGPKAPLPDMHYYFGHYHAALATWAAGGAAHKAWYPAARDQLLGRQKPGGEWPDLICHHYGTAMALIALQAPGGLLSPEF